MKTRTTKSRGNERMYDGEMLQGGGGADELKECVYLSLSPRKHGRKGGQLVEKENKITASPCRGTRAARRATHTHLLLNLSDTLSSLHHLNYNCSSGMECMG